MMSSTYTIKVSARSGPQKKPRSRRAWSSFLFQAHFVFSSGLNKEFGLLHVDGGVVGEFSLEKGCFDVKMMEMEVLRPGDCEKSAHGGGHADGSKRFVVVNLMALLATVGNQTSLVPFAVDWSATRRQIRKLPARHSGICQAWATGGTSCCRRVR